MQSRHTTAAEWYIYSLLCEGRETVEEVFEVVMEAKLVARWANCRIALSEYLTSTTRDVEALTLEIVR